jgi:hypothetical protein
VARVPADVEQALDTLSEAHLAEYGVVLEPNLLHVLTLSVGRVTIDRVTVSYVGTQRQTRDNEGHAVYGGSELTVVRGDWAAHDRLDLGPGTRQAVHHAIAYDGAADRIRGFFASRRNYDVAIGSDRRRHRRVGVLEASWCVGGASPAEFAALLELRRDRGTTLVRVATVERYGEQQEVPEDALVHYHARDPVAGPVLRYTRIEERRAA